MNRMRLHSLPCTMRGTHALLHSSATTHQNLYAPLHVRRKKRQPRHCEVAARTTENSSLGLQSTNFSNVPLRSVARNFFRGGTCYLKKTPILIFIFGKTPCIIKISGGGPPPPGNGPDSLAEKEPSWRPNEQVRVAGHSAASVGQREQCRGCDGGDLWMIEQAQHYS